MGFIILLVLTTLAIAGSAAFFSVFGLAQIFTGAYWSVVLMGSSLEAGKLVAASFLYRYWEKISNPMRIYLFSAVIALMGITSMGIFGYLSNAFQDNVLPYQQQSQQIELLQADKAEAETLKAERLAREAQINKQIADLPNNYVNGRNRLMAANKEELTQIRKDIAAYTQQIRDDTTKLAEVKAQVLKETSHVGPIVFIAEVFGADVSHATKWLILLIIVVFDPLAVILTIAANMVILERKSEIATAIPEPHVLSTESMQAVVDAPTVVEPVQISTPVVEPVNKPTSEFEKAHEMFSKDTLTPQEQSVKSSLEQMIRRYSSMLNTDK